MYKFFILVPLFLSACSGMQFNTNIGPYAKSTVKTVIVKEYSFVEMAKYDATQLGSVKASYCQSKIDEPKPSKRRLVNDLKVQAIDLGANGLVVEECGKSVSAMCINTLECRGTAYAVPEQKSRP